MNTKTTLSISDARKKIFKISDEAQRGNYYTLTEKGRPKVVIMSAEEFESWQETLEVMHEFPHLKKDMKEARRDYTSGRYKTYTTLDEILSQDGYILTKKPKKKYAVSRQLQTKRRKRS